ncbi:hypothetical protein JT321_gp58 [Providencia phage Kokobel1]|uniref:Uncharacterized protein n=1 Tax=Providencia phage Kokobel1 TaxID=2783540 RepID=A0A873WNI4_9CAUD|nr:hypothetical protein JT321_gp58 [Providencia phage Kokobel1]QPB11485.1 hypothetical protein [Providencia phage Kokobel1]
MNIIKGWYRCSCGRPLKSEARTKTKPDGGNYRAAEFRLICGNCGYYSAWRSSLGSCFSNLKGLTRR